MISHTLPALAAVAVSVVNSGFGRMLRPAASSFRIRDERPRDVAAREALLDRSFGPDRFVKTSERLREGRLPAEGLSFVAVDGDRILGTLRFWSIEAGRRPSLMLGPLAVDADHRSAGIGRALGGQSPQDKLDRVAALQQAGHRVAMIGDGMNDGPVLARADLSIAMGQGVPIAQQRSDFIIQGGRLDAEIGQRALPGGVGRICPMLEGAAAARDEMGAGGCCAVWAGFEHLRVRGPTIAAPGGGRGAD